MLSFSLLLFWVNISLSICSNVSNDYEYRSIFNVNNCYDLWRSTAHDSSKVYCRLLKNSAFLNKGVLLNMIHFHFSTYDLSLSNLLYTVYIDDIDSSIIMAIDVSIHVSLIFPNVSLLMFLRLASNSADDGLPSTFAEIYDAY